MKLASLSILTALALIFAGLTVAESTLYQAWDRALDQQRIIQLKVAYFRQQNGVGQELLRRLAVESQRDPALAELLKQKRIKVVIKGQEAPPTDGSSAPAAVEKPTQTSPVPTPSNP